MGKMKHKPKCRLFSFRADDETAELIEKAAKDSKDLSTFLRDAARSEAVRVRTAKRRDTCPVCGVVDQEPFGPDGHRLGADCPQAV